MTQSARLYLRMFRWEVAFAAATATAGLVGLLLVLVQLGTTAPQPECVASIDAGPGTGGEGCPATLSGFLDARALGTIVLYLSTASAIAAGVILGSQAIGREIDQGTAQFAWTIDPRRRRWLRDRFAVAVGVLLACVLPLSVVAALVVSAQYPATNILETFGSYGLWGPLVVARALAALGIGLLSGTVLGRAVPSLLLALVVSVAAVAAMATAAPAGIETSAREATDVYDPSVLWRGRAYTTVDGAIVSIEQARDSVPDSIAPIEVPNWIESVYRPVELVVDGSLAPAVAARELLLVLLVAVAATAASFRIALRRRPH